ncbi:MAG: 50S ribosomal protein L21 [Mycoplasmataceae bacterium]|jgi:large subunit ribosomal protein L21|nr:50S ribosomal protein L21 [Mycoplasmataceae bacterium]
MFAIISVGNKQYKVEKDSAIYVEKIVNEPGSLISVKEVLMVDDKIGNPFVKGAEVVCQIEKHGKQEKIHIIHHISQKHHTKRMGHRQKYTKLIVKEIKI